MKRFFFLLLLACCLLIAPAAAAGGSGTAADPYIVQTAVELQSMQNNLAAYYKLASDINLQGVTFTPIGSASSPFTGSFDGAGYTISNLVISSSTQSTGFFSCLGSGATIKDVTFQDCSVTSTLPQCGVVIGSIIMSSSAHETAVISNVDCVRCSANSDSYYVACLAGFISTSAVVEITNCNVNYCIIETSLSNAGCLIAQCNSALSVKIMGCNILSSIARAGDSCVGAFVSLCGRSTELIIDSSTVQNSILESVNTPHVGIFVGACANGVVVNVLNSDAINSIAKGLDNIGGIFGYCENSDITAQMCNIVDCSIVATNSKAGGVVGRFIGENTCSLSGCLVKDSIIIAPSYAATICPAFS